MMPRILFRMYALVLMQTVVLSVFGIASSTIHAQEKKGAPVSVSNNTTQMAWIEVVDHWIDYRGTKIESPGKWAINPKTTTRLNDKQGRPIIASQFRYLITTDVGSTPQFPNLWTSDYKSGKILEITIEEKDLPQVETLKSIDGLLASGKAHVGNKVVVERAEIVWYGKLYYSDKTHNCIDVWLKTKQTKRHVALFGDKLSAKIADQLEAPPKNGTIYIARIKGTVRYNDKLGHPQLIADEITIGDAVLK